MFLRNLLLATAVALTSALPLDNTEGLHDVSLLTPGIQMSQLRRGDGMRMVSRPHEGPTPRSKKPVSGLESLMSKGDAIFLADLKIGDFQSFEVRVDLASADTWVVFEDYVCATEPCNFGPGLGLDTDGEFINDTNFEVLRPDGVHLNGFFFPDAVTFANVTVESFYIGVVKRAELWKGDGTSSGVAGLAFPAKTAAYQKDFYNNPTLVGALFGNDGILPRLSIAISRDESGSGDGGWLTMGGVPDDLSFPNINVTSEFASAPLEISPLWDEEFKTFYAFTVDSVSYSSAKSSKTYQEPQQFIVASSSTLNYFPIVAAKAFNELFDPPAIQDELGTWIVDCSAIAPQLSLSIGGRDFPQNPYDLILRSGSECYSAVQSHNGGSRDLLYVLGEPFLRNVLAVFDWSKHVYGGTVLLAARPYYQS